MSVTLNSEQEFAVDQILETARLARHMSLQGPAGTGKSTTLMAACRKFTNLHPQKRIMLLAPTHKACKQLKGIAKFKNVWTKTVDKFCKTNVKQIRDEDTFEANLTKICEIVQELKTNKVGLVIVDESSMLKGDLAKLIRIVCSDAEVGVCFCGDPYQLPPVNPSKQMNTEDLDGDIEQDKIEEDLAVEFTNAPVKVILDKVMRHDGAVLDHATKIRRSFNVAHSFPAASSPPYSSGSRIIVEKKSRALFNSEMTHLYNLYKRGQLRVSDYFKKAPRFVAFRNDTVKDITKQLRGELYGKGATSLWVPGEIVMFPNLTYTAFGQFIHSCTEATVIDVEQEHLKVDEIICEYTTPGGRKQKKVELKIDGKILRATVAVIDKGEQSIEEKVVYTTVLDDSTVEDQYKVARKALIESRAPKDGDEWKKLYAFRKLYLNTFMSAFVMTVHKAQGSTFETVYVAYDLMHVRDIDLRNRLHYVATTRASEVVVFSKGRSFAFGGQNG